MDILGKNGPLLRTLVGFFGVSSVQATTDAPAAQIKLSFKRRGVKHESSFSLQELLDGLTETTLHAHTEPPGDYTDIADIE